MAEYQDIYDIHRQHTGKKLLRGTPRGLEEYILVVHLLVFDRQGRFLVQKRVPDKASWPDMWDISLGGIAQSGDDSRRACEREAMEELGLRLDLTDTEPVFSFRSGNTFDDYWMVEVDTVELSLQPEEVAEVRWVDRAGWEALLATHQVIPYTFQHILFDLYDRHFPGTRLFPRPWPTQVLGAAFDMDGLLLDTERVADKAWDDAAAQLGFADVEHAKKACIGLNEAATRAWFEKTYGKDFDYDAFRNLARQLSHAVTDVEVPVKEGAAEILQMLRDQGVKLAVASSTREVTVRDQLARAGLLGYFDAVVTGDMVTHSKPHPEIFTKACAALGLPPESCLAFEDSLNGIRSAYRAGLYTIHVPDLVPDNLEARAMSGRTFRSLTEAAEAIRKSMEGRI